MIKSRTISYGRQSIDKEDIRAVLEVLQSDWLTQGPKIKEFEDALCAYTGAKYAVAVSSGTAALHIACLAGEIRPRDEVITSPITFAASANCILYCGGKPVFADVQRDTANIDPNAIKQKISRKTRAILPVHFSGHPCDLEEIHALARKNGLLIIEDAAHALGAVYKKSLIGSCKYSDMTIFSFHPVKSITTGEGGAILTNKINIYKKLLACRNHGIIKDKKEFLHKNRARNGDWYHEMQSLGFNYRLTDFQCALGISQIKKIDTLLARRREISSIYNERLIDLDSIVLPVEKLYVNSSWHLYCIRIKRPSNRKAIFEKLRRSGIGVQVHYIPVYQHPYYHNLGYKKMLCKNAEDFYGQEISIPLYPGMTDKDVNYVVKVLKEMCV